MQRSEMAARATLIALFGFVLYLMYRIFQPFLAGVLWSIVLVVAFHPIHARLTRLLRGRSGLAAAIMSLLVAAVVVIPCVIAVVKVGEGVMEGYEWLTRQVQTVEGGTSLLERSPALASAAQWLGQWIDLKAIDFRGIALSALRAVGSYLAGKSGAWVADATATIVNFVVMLLTMAVLFRTGPSLVGSFREFLPFPEAEREEVFSRLHEVTRAVFFGVLLTAMVQGILGGIGTALAGLPQPVAFGAAMFLFALLPAGTALIWGPAAAWLLLNGSMWSGLFLAAWGIVVVSLIDNLLRPLFIGGGVRMHWLLIFLGTFGGLIAFGLVGLFIGPLVITLFLFLADLLRRDLFRSVPVSAAASGSSPTTPAGPGTSSGSTGRPEVG